MELRAVVAFVGVAEELNFARAADRLTITPSRLSQQIRHLERDLGARLFDRSTRHVELTPAGAAFLVEARRLLATAARARSVAHNAQVGLSGRLAIGFTGSATHDLLPSVARAYRRLRPLVALELHGELGSAEQVAALHDDIIDVGLLRPPVTAPDIDTFVVWHEEFVVVLPDDHPLSGRESVGLVELNDSDFVAYPGGMAAGIVAHVHQACARAGFSPRIVHESPHTYSLLCLVAAGFGVAVVPKSTAAVRVNGVVFVPIADDVPTIGLAAAWRSEGRSPLVDEFLAVLRDHISTSAATARPG
ncbi:MULTISPECIES: LysR family transcriptional regulator [unclassified Rhodococcus (in: high G+C Gram-positive bacteria)]|uniref:LysR family transcriptional regulator n=1 Tax=unclassified Rhodococcus (in: high G+C Gram-positive bacteria) TaxID=192944 RepID=UPI000B9BC261|nr:MULTISPECIES: LysR family transcriptional regulator [unclassified Rhodococcus (in: high G+C Gram-positive bacteria)]OZE37614.1 hypothetical protein CH259_12280 [Rhodococcus sp. 05-2254-4]OZE40746.1 hypothetical protein CH261_27245 [Rhodococcus sp. 05-2254-3]OZE45737.1 hypothetical protein CH283_25900 [Rhodococcus sp. 05-2254-2]